ncbi:MAG: DUF2330 domain-containing protein [Archangium sp.]|nr:DUF2330 domain-containing protein [Archangium sp.]MDP3158355.1 DUF2330 domain-containing protein [Archangium sp.]MDP3569356.1 DUF2330 domain-containing protein [Archangium sp.]
MIRVFIAALTVVSASAHAFCGFYVAGGGAELFNNATQVVLMREGTRTVLSMQNNYQGPPEDFAMVIPVPVVLKKENVKTLKKEIFSRIDTLAAPRLVEYWEVDPCYVEPPDTMDFAFSAGAPGLGLRGMGVGGGGLGVKVEAQFSVGEYDVVVLSAKDALGLETWLKQEKYKIPSGAEPLFRPYIQQGMKFFVAKVNAKKVTFDKNGMAALSPLRFHYDSEKFELPIRLGLINAKAQQDLIVHVLARNQRYEVANYPNVTIPTNIDLVPSAKSEFPFFYVSLFDRTAKANPKAVITEYAWQASSCDPCPTSPLTEEDFQTLGADVVSSKGKVTDPYDPRQGYVLTRLHARYDKSSLGEDLVFRAAKPIVGGREFLTNGKSLEQGSRPDSLNNFQARYAIRYPWTAEVKCEKPVYGRWGGPPAGKTAEGTKAAQGTAFVERDPAKVERLSESPIAELQVKGLKLEAGKPLRKK